MNNEASLDELVQFLNETTHRLDKEAYPGEKISIKEQFIDESNHKDSYIDYLNFITPMTIREVLYVEMPCEPPDTSTIADWLREARKCDDNFPTLFLYGEPQCACCGHDPDIYYELCYTKDKTC